MSVQTSQKLDISDMSDEELRKRSAKLAASNPHSSVQIDLKLNFWHQATTQYVRVSWSKVHLGGERAWMHCPHCQARVARLYAGLGGYFCRRFIGNPSYATQRLGAQGRAHYQACKLRLQLDGQAQLTMPFPQRPARIEPPTNTQVVADEAGTRMGITTYSSPLSLRWS